MRFGICGDLEVARRAMEAGFDYTEAGASRFALESPFSPSPYREVRTETSNLFFPSSIQLLGPSATPYLDYAQKAVERAAEIGISVMVIGSGASRRAPEGVDYGTERFADIAQEVAYIAKPFGIRIAPESLNQSETNVGNDLGRLARLLEDRGVGYTADSYHVLYEQTEPNWEDQIPFAPDHVHIADRPRKGVDASDPLLVDFARRLREVGYDRRVSLEANLPDTEVGTLARQLVQLRRLFAEGV